MKLVTYDDGKVGVLREEEIAQIHDARIRTMGTPGLGKMVGFAQSYGLTTQLYALALATGVLGVATHVLFTWLERRALRWHPSQRLEAA